MKKMYLRRLSKLRDDDDCSQRAVVFVFCAADKFVQGPILACDWTFAATSIVHSHSSAKYVLAWCTFIFIYNHCESLCEIDMDEVIIICSKLLLPLNAIKRATQCTRLTYTRNWSDQHFFSSILFIRLDSAGDAKNDIRQKWILTHTDITPPQLVNGIYKCIQLKCNFTKRKRKKCTEYS